MSNTQRLAISVLSCVVLIYRQTSNMAARVLQVPVRLLLLVLATFTYFINGEVLTPPYFNLAQQRQITATATCGENVAVPEWFCRLTGATGEEKMGGTELIRGQYCDYCDPNQANKAHPAQYAIDGTERWWQSPPLSRGMSYNEINLTIDLAQEFHVAYVLIKTANSPRPGVWALERSVDFGQSWKPWQYFADTPSDCNKFFGVNANTELLADDTVICTTHFSKIVPLEDGEIVVSLVNNRPNANNFSYAETLQSWTKATNVRLRLLRTKTLLGHLMAVARQDSTVTRRYFYSIKDISIGGRCVCNGHADTCDRADPSHPNKLVCNCQHNTCGDQCDICCPRFIQKKWQPGRVDRPFQCEPCQCYGHSTECVYNEEVDMKGQSIDIHGRYEGGGVCQNCQHNTMGINCDQCVPGYFNPYGVPLDSLEACVPCECDDKKYTGECDAGTGRCQCSKEYTGQNCDRCSYGYYGYPDCIPCDCNLNGTENEVCTVGGGQCPCKQNFVGKSCDMCAFEYFNFPECTECSCNSIGSLNNVCDVETGQCSCEINFTGLECDTCQNGFFSFPTCSNCDCEARGAEEGICDKDTGTCMCRSNFLAPRCDRCAPEYYGFPLCSECQCADPGSMSRVCREDGQCLCKPNFAGLTCSRCAPGYYRYPECLPCSCDLYGSIGQSCDQETGQCDCNPTFEELMCNKCKEGFYNYPNCEECNCNPAGAKQVPGQPLGGCGVVIKGLLCECKERVMGRICDQCKPGYFNLDRNNPLGCNDCDCYAPGTVSGLNACNSVTGQCMCKLDAGGRRCDTCRDGYYGLSESNPFGCIECNCDMGGSVNNVCDKRTGQCRCKPRVQGRRCESPDQMHFFPTLQQLIYEVEDGRTPEGSRIRYGFDNTIFANYSWRGYAILTHLQPEVVMDITITRPSLYRVIYRYENLNELTIKGEVTLKPESIADVAQMSEVVFVPAEKPRFVTVGSSDGVYDFVLNPGRWTISIKVPDIILLDYMVLVPQAYYEATVLQQAVTRPCTIPNDDGPCLLYNYPDLSQFPTQLGSDGFVIDQDNNTVNTQIFTDRVVLNELGLPALAKLDKNQPNLNLNLEVPIPGEYVLVLNYYALSNTTQELKVIIRTPEEETMGTVLLHNCQYSVLCREIVKGADNMPLSPFINRTAEIFIMGDDDIDVAIGSIVAIPYPEWSLGFIHPSIICIRINGICVGSSYASPSGSVRIEFEDPPNQDLKVGPEYLPPKLADGSVGLVLLNNTDPFVELEGNVLVPSHYVFVVHFYLPKEVGINMPVKVQINGKFFDGDFKPRYCPTTSGCRGLIYFNTADGNNILHLTEDKVKIAFNNTSGKDIWMDYLLLIPATQFSPSDLNIQPVDNSGNFLENCVGPGFELISDTEFCRKGVFSLTTDFNNGALSCRCNIDGSMSFGCSDFGGQCRCRENVIGRDCTHCREGFYGFPNCRPCNCPYGTCHELTGECICPRRVTGERCDECVPATYGYDALVGCTDCDCRPEGVLNNDMNCEQMSGQCSCKDNIAGRKCDHCVKGFYGYPYCDLCQCDLLGTQEEVCDPTTGVCVCKDNVAPPFCDACRPGSFYLNIENPKGCTQCFCFGTTTTCSSSDLLWKQFKDMKGWSAVNINQDAVTEAGDIVAVLNADQVTNSVIYWSAPSTYLGNKVIAYGGKLMFSIVYMLPRDDPTISDKETGPGIVLQGRNMTVVHYFSQDLQPSRIHELDVELYEFKFVHSDTKSSVSREQFMMILVNLEHLHIRASYYNNVGEVRLMNVTLEMATEDGNNGFADSVEHCQCPVGYTGTSCEQCAQGFYRAGTTPYLGICVPCECYGHSDTCDSNTGECLACVDNTMGSHCEKCLPGYYGDATTGVCRICSCPLPIPSNNFASGCSVSEGRLLSCQCDTGYSGLYCERCAPGYYGNSREQGSSCKPCGCSGNIDMNNPASCSASTGECLLCMNNSTGQDCSRCLSWWYGDAVNAKNCQPCACNRCGSDICDEGSGVCTCKPNVIGVNCDRCAPDMYGFDSCNGCRDCNCEAASYSTQCDLSTGQCPCKPGTTGRTCDQCIEGYWNYSPDGCQKCNCEEDGAVSCDAVSGVCRCLPGVTGPTCDRCLPRWVLIPNEGCKACENCVHILLDDVEFLDRNVSGLANTLETVSVGVSAMKRLQAINDSVERLKPEVDVLPVPGQAEKTRALILNQQFITTKFGEAEQLMLELTQKAEDVEGEAVLVSGNGDKVESDIMMVANEVVDAVKFVDGVLETIERSSQVTNIDSYIQMSKDILDQVLMANFSGREDLCDMDMDEANRLIMKIQEMQTNSTLQIETVENMKKQADKISEALYDLQANTRDSDTVAGDTMDLIKRLRDFKLSIIEVWQLEIKETNTDTKMLIEMAKDLLDKADMANGKTKNATTDVERLSTSLDSAINQLKVNNDMLGKGLNDTDHLLNRTNAHADDLVETAKLLESVYTNTRGAASNALDAAKAYKDIVMAIQDAYNASTAAVNASVDALGKSNGVGETSANSKNKSSVLLADADQRVEKVQTDLQDRLKNAKMATDEVDSVNMNVEEDLKFVNDGLKSLDIDDIGLRAQVTAKSADEANQKATGAQSKVNDILNKLPADTTKVSELVNNMARARKDSEDTKEQTKFVKDSVPKIEELINLIGTRAKNIQPLRTGVMANITELREKINLARDQANRIRVAMEFLGNTTVALRNPPNVDQSGSFTRLSMHIKTQQTDALLAYVGAKFVPDRPGPTPDYMSLELSNGQVVFRFNLGSGPAEITHPWNVADGQWYRIKAERIGKTGSLTLSRDEDPEIVEEKVHGNSSGTFAVLELNSLTRFYFGGVPSTVMLPSGVPSKFFEGVMEDVEFDDRPMGLWNFVYGENNYVGALERNVLRTTKSTGYSFNGKGYAILSASEINFRPNTKATIIMKFKTYAPNGLLLFMGKGRDFTSLELRDGKVYFQYDLGGSPAKIMSANTYNDGKWHRIQAARNKQDGNLRIDDNVENIPGKSPGTLTGLAYTDNIYIGGYTDLLLPVGGVNSIGFDGCIEDVQFSGTSWDLIKNKAAINVIRGCPEKVLRTATFQEGGVGYIAVPADSIGVNFDVTFRMRTDQDNSLLLYTSNSGSATNAVFSVSVVGGKIVATSDTGGDLTRLESNNTYNDGNPHYVAIMKMGRKLMMNIDDQEMVNKTAKSQVDSVDTTRPIYFGGTDITVPDNLVGSSSPFSGCISDITINGKFVNFATIQRQNIRGVGFAECTVGAPQVDVTGEPPVVTPGRLDSTTAEATVDQCALPKGVDLSGTGGEVTGVLFGKNVDSRHVYRQMPASMRVRSQFTVDIKTTAESGVIYYASDTGHTDFLAMYMKEGRIGFAFNCGSGRARILSPEKYNDGQWHTVNFGRNARSGSMKIDGVFIGTLVSPGTTKSLNVRAPYFVGGLPKNTDKAKNNLDGSITGFVGCIRNFVMGVQPLGQPAEIYGTESCRSTIEQGVFFHGAGGYVQLYDKFRVGLDLKISVDIRPRNLTGVILSVHAKGGDFLVLQMKDGKLIFSTDNGGGVITTEYTPPEKNALCDGNWHTISAQKAKNVLLMTVDDGSVITGLGKEGVSSADTSDPLYVGGLPDSNAKAVVADGNYLGCIRNLVLSEKQQFLTSGQTTGDVKLDFCPVN